MYGVLALVEGSAWSCLKSAARGLGKTGSANERMLARPFRIGTRNGVINDRPGRQHVQPGECGMELADLMPPQIGELNW
jgi:hypothetical protein